MLMLTNLEGNRYFFGKVPEGTQRVLNEQGVRLGRLRSIFITGVVSSWSDIGGLPGLFLTLSDAIGRGIDVFTNSSKMLSYVVATWRFFVFRRGATLNIMDTDNEAIIGDSKTIFFPIKITKNALVTENLPNSKDNSLLSGIQKIILYMFPKEANVREPDTDLSAPSDTELHTHVKLPLLSNIIDTKNQKSLNFVIRFVPARGKFDAEKAKQLGLKPGIKYKNLTDGMSVHNEKNELIHPHQVMSPPASYPKLVILDIPDQQYLQGTIQSEEWFVQNDERGHEVPGLVYHFLGDSVDFRLEEYVQFINKFPADCQHVISHSSIAADTLVFRTYAIHMLKLKSIMNNNFNLPHMEQHEISKTNVTSLQSLQNFNITTAGVTRIDEDVPCDTWESLYSSFDISEKPSFETLFEKSILPLGLKEGPLKEKVQIVTLGTGSALPSIHRNVLSTLVRIPFEEGGENRYTSILLDAGENTLGTLMRNYGHNGHKQLTQIFGELSLIFLSHLHADHHLGMVSVISRWLEENAENKRKLYLVIPWQFKQFLIEWFEVEFESPNIDLNRLVCISCELFMRNPEREPKQLSMNDFTKIIQESKAQQIRVANADNSALKEQLFKDLHIDLFQTVRAIHCHWAYCVSIVFNLSKDSVNKKDNKFKISFSGDTRPNTRFINIGQNSDLLIHEASLRADLIEEALAKKHTTVVEAVRVAQLMHCRKVILTHFSARFSGEHSFIENKKDYEDACTELGNYLGDSHGNIFSDKDSALSFDEIQVCYAYDYLTLWLGDLGFQRDLYGAINQLNLPKDDEVQKLKEEKENMKKKEKRATKRLQRLAMDKKRKTNPLDRNGRNNTQS